MTLISICDLCILASRLEEGFYHSISSFYSVNCRIRMKVVDQLQLWDADSNIELIFLLSE